MRSSTRRASSGSVRSRSTRPRSRSSMPWRSSCSGSARRSLRKRLAPPTTFSKIRSSMGSGTHQGDSERSRSRSTSRCSSRYSPALRSTLSMTTRWWPSSRASSRTRASTGAASVASNRASTACSMAADASRSSSTSATPRQHLCDGAAGAVGVGWLGQPRAGAAARHARRGRARASRSGARKFCWTNEPRLRPIRSLLAGMIAVWGMGRPSGRRNSAVTANQSARRADHGRLGGGPDGAHPGGVVLHGAGHDEHDRGGQQEPGRRGLHPSEAPATLGFVRRPRRPAAANRRWQIGGSDARQGRRE